MKLTLLLCVALAHPVIALFDVPSAQMMRGAPAKTGEAEATIYPMEQKDAVVEARRLQGMNNFVPLSCNAALETQPSCPSWTSVLGSSTFFPERVIVACGSCVTMDQQNLTLAQGLDIQGKLVFPDGFTGTVQTASLTVQGQLEMLSTGPVDGTPKIRIIMIGDQAQTFTPMGENAANCGSGGSCNVSHKAITVAGGKVNIQGIGPSNPTWLRLQNVEGGTFNNPTSIIVDISVLNQWLPGAVLLITSHTRRWNDHQVRQIVSVSEASGYARIELNSTIRRPTTMMESTDFAVEVALLSRNIVFEGGQGLQDGGHLWIFHTPSVVQSIVGVDIQHFGQQGTLGRYPIHFHFCGDVSGSVVRKNTIRKSHQRCIVVHGSNNLVVEDNVAFDSFGHCFIMEDGIETGNFFLRNLGAQIDAPVTLIANNGPETDKENAIFWLTNPNNYVEGNVAAGSSSGTGIWFELKKRGPLKDFFPDPIYEPLGSFINNVAHSNTGRLGAVRLYPTGFLPNGSTENIFTGLKVYRNTGTGIFIHKVQYFGLTGSIFSDNDKSIDLDRSEAIEVSDTTIIGMSESYTALMARETGTGKICSAQGRASGIELHSWRLRNVEGAFNIKNVDIRGFGGLDCRDPSAIQMDPFSLKQGGFEVYTSFSSMLVEDGASFLDFCYAEAGGVNSVYLMDLDGSLAPSSISTSGPCALISNNPKMTSFVDAAKCTLIEVGCYQYCRETCFNSIRYTVDTTNSKDFELKVCQRTNPSSCIIMQWSKRENSADPFGDDPRTFLVHLPSGNYDAAFVDGLGNEVWPTYVERHDELALCSASVDVAMVTPTVPIGHCSELIRNGKAEASSTEPTAWLSVSGGLKVAQGVGVDNSNALTGSKFDSAKMLQYLDTRCLKEGTTYKVTGKVRLEDSTGNVSVCNPGTDPLCPSIGLFIEGSGDRAIASLSLETDASGYQFVEGTFEVDTTIANSDRVNIFVNWIERKSTSVKRRVLVDDFSVVLVDGDPSGEFIVAPASAPVPLPSDSWTKAPSADPTGLPSATPTGVPSTDRPTRGPTKSPSANPTAMPSGRPSSSPSRLPSASPTKRPTSLISVNTRQPVESLAAVPNATPHSLPTPPSFTAPTISPPTNASAPTPSLPPFSIESDGKCENLIANSDMEFGVASYWEQGSGLFTLLGTSSGYQSPTALEYFGGLFALLFASTGPAYNARENMDMTCFTPGSKWELRAQIRLLSPFFGGGAACTLGSTCPKVNLVIRNGRGTQVFALEADDYVRAWNANGFNELRATFEVPSSGWDGSVSAVSIDIGGYFGWFFSSTLVVDDFAIRPEVV